MNVEKTIKLPDASDLREIFDYDPGTGILSWRKKTGPRSVIGGAVGHRSRHGMTMRLHNVSYLVHRIIWKWMIGEDPPLLIDHVNGDPFDNRWSNLRLATAQENARNRKPHSGRDQKGVYRIKKTGRWLVRLHRPGVSAHVGTCATREEAVAARNAAEVSLFGPFARIG